MPTTKIDWDEEAEHLANITPRTTYQPRFQMHKGMVSITWADSPHYGLADLFSRALADNANKLGVRVLGTDSGAGSRWCMILDTDAIAEVKQDIHAEELALQVMGVDTIRTYANDRAAYVALFDDRSTFAGELWPLYSVGDLAGAVETLAQHGVTAVMTKGD